jgi:hypothetical protein
MMNSLKAAVLSAALVAAGVVTAGAAEPTSTTPAYPLKVATNPGLPYSSAPTPYSTTGPSSWTRAIPSTARPNSGIDTGGYYSRKGFGPSSDCSSGQNC